MNIFYLSFAYIRARALTNVLLVSLLAIGMATLVLLTHFGHQAEQRLAGDAKGIDLVVGAKGSPLQLILSTVYHTDIPTGNISVRDAEAIRRLPEIASTIPMALGDSYRGFRIIGSEASYISLYDASIASGRIFQRPMEAVIGHDVAVDARLTLDATFAGSHGLEKGGDIHEDRPYTVVGVLAPTGSIIDRLIITPVESVWKIHSHHAHEESDHQKDEHAHKDEHNEQHVHEEHITGREITALLVKYKSPVSAISVPRKINQTTALQAASPAFEITRLLVMLGIGIDTLRLFAIIISASAVIGLLVSIYQSMQQRTYDIALMRCFGAPAGTIVKQIMCEITLLLFFGIILGIGLGHVSLWLLPEILAPLKDFHLNPALLLKEEMALAAVIFFSGTLVSLIPAFMAYRVDVSRTLARA
ncbi:MAG: ABC transporter permease [Alphaproteobacteria bacterium]